MSNHHRKPVNFSDDELRMCEKALARLEDAVANAIFAASIDPDEIGRSEWPVMIRGSMQP